ncbi:hypothetical protein ACF0H5_015338 [Mactra antiquata]
MVTPYLIGTSDLFGGQNDGQSSLFNWADEFLGDETDATSNAVAMESGNLATNINQPNHLLSTQNYAVTSSIPTQNVAIATSQFLSTPTVLTPQQTSSVLGQTLVSAASTSGLTTQLVQQSNQGNQQFILRTSSGNQIQLNRQALQLQQQLLQQQQQQHVASSPSFHQILSQHSVMPSNSSTIMNRSLTPNAEGLSYSGTAVTQTVTQLRTSPAPNVNLVHLPPNIQQQQQPPTQQQQLNQQQTHQFQIAPGTILQIPAAGASGSSPNLVSTTLFQGQQALLGNNQQGTLVNAQNTVIQNPNVVNVNVAAQHVLCNNPAQQQRTNLGLTNIQTASPSPFNIQGTLIQTAEGKSILIPSQNIAQPINIQGLSVATPAAQSQPISIQGLSVATPVAQPQIQQPAQNTVANMLQLAQQQQPQPQQQQQPGFSVDNRTGQGGVQQIVLNHQGQQILVQRAQTTTGQPQNIIVRTAGGQSGIVQLQQRTGTQQVATQLQGSSGQSGIVQLQQRPGQTTIQNAQQTLQALAASGGNQQIKFVNQTAGNSTQQTVPVINIGGQNVTLQQITNQLSNIQGLKLQQQQQPLQQTQNILQPQQEALTFQGQGQDQGHNNPGQITMNQGQAVVNQQFSNQIISQPNVISSQVPIAQSTSDTSANSVENQTRLILQKIHNSLKKSQAEAVNSAAATVSNIQALQNKNIGQIKQEFVPSSSSMSSLNSPYSSVTVKTEPNLIETLIKQEKGVSSSCDSLGLPSFLTCSAQSTCTSATSSQASTPMSLFLMSSSQNIHSNSSLSSVSAMDSANLLSSASDSKSGISLQTKNFLQNTSIGSTAQTNQSSALLQQSQTGSVSQPVVSGSTSQPGQTGTATLQTIQLPPELQQQLQRVQLEMRKVQSSTTMTAQQKRDKFLQLQVFQKKILLKGRVLATTRTEQSQVKPDNSNLLPQVSVTQTSTVQSSINTSSQLPDTRLNYASPSPSNSGLKNLLRQDDNTQVQPDSTSNLGQVPQISNSVSDMVGSSTQISTSSSLPLLPTCINSTSLSQPSSYNVTMTTNNVTASTSSTSTDSTPQVAVPTQIKIADKVLTLSLTQAQKDKVQSYLDKMTPEQQQQYLQTQQHVLHRIQKQQALKAQIQAQTEAQKKRSELAAMSQGGASNITPAPSMSQNEPQQPQSSSSSNIVPEVKVIPVPNTRINTQLTSTGPTTVIRGQKRSYMDIPKGTLINQQIRQDQNHASNPDTKRPFRSRGDACRRLLRYHVFQNYGPSTEDFNKFDSYMEDISEDLLKKKDRMFDKFRHLLVQETLRVHPSSELVMLQRMQNQDLRKTLEEERLLVKQDPESFEPMPMKFLCKKENRTESMSDLVDIKQEQNEEINSDTSCEDITDTVTEIKEEPIDTDSKEEETKASKMRKLVIKTDGLNFRSSFKRVSLDSSRSSVDEQLSQDPSMNSDVSVTMDVDDDDDDTNDYSNDKFDSIHDEDERAVLALSSAEDSQNTQLDSNLDVYNVDNSQNTVDSDNDEQMFKGKRNFEIHAASDSVLTDNRGGSNKSLKKSTDFSSEFSSHASVDGSKSNIPKINSDKSIASSITEMDDSDTEDKFGGFQSMKDSLTDKYGMYQPITESLTDSEENSYYSADNAADQHSVMNDEDDLQIQGHWNKSNKDQIDSDDDSDPEVKAQMESAINSILSLNQGTTNEPSSVYSYSSQSNQFFNQDSQSNSLYDTNSLQADLNFQADVPQGSSTNKAGRKSPSDNFGHDLDAAVNSILM